MTPLDLLARGLAAALLAGAWERRAMVARLCKTVGGEPKPWMQRLARGAASQPRDDLDVLAAWVQTRDEVREARAAGVRIVHHAMPKPEMRESPWPVPALATPHELAVWLGIDDATLETLADRRGILPHYRSTWLRKASGGHRLVEAPRFALRVLQRRILDGILARIPPHAAAHGFRAGASIAGFARPHVGREVVVRVDLEAFFSSVVRSRVLGILRTAGYPSEVARTMAALCTHRTLEPVLARAPERDPRQFARLRTAHLPQGAPTSGALATSPRIASTCASPRSRPRSTRPTRATPTTS